MVDDRAVRIPGSRRILDALHAEGPPMIFTNIAATLSAIAFVGGWLYWGFHKR